MLWVATPPMIDMDPIISQSSHTASNTSWCIVLYIYCMFTCIHSMEKHIWMCKPVPKPWDCFFSSHTKPLVAHILLLLMAGPNRRPRTGLFFLSFPFERFCMETSLSINRHCSKNKQWMLRRSNAWVLKGLADYEEEFISVSSICQCSVFPDSLNHLLPEFNQPKTCLIAFARFLHLTSSLFK